MPRALLLLAFALAAMCATMAAGSRVALRTERSAPDDLEIGGEIAGQPAGAVRYLRYEDLRHLPQEKYTVGNDSNFAHGTMIEGVALETLTELYAQAPDSALIVAICNDKYRTSYPREYLAAHHAVLVLEMNGQTREHWPAAPGGGSLGPYLISHPFFKPAFRVLSHDDEPQIPYGVIRLEFRNEATVFGAIRPSSQSRADEQVQQGNVIARQDCFRCHNSGAQGGTMAARSWSRLGHIAASNPTRFRAIIHAPASVTPGAKMPAHSDYDDATLDALTAYFRTFAEKREESRHETTR